MTLTYSQIQERLEVIEADLADRCEDFELAAEQVHRLARDYELRHARALMASKAQTATERKAEATIAIAAAEDGLYEKLKEAEGRYEGLKAAIRVLEQRATIGQSLLKTHTREAIQNGPQPSWSRT